MSAVRLALAAALAAACYDPVHLDDVAALGPEAADAPPGPLHRPGQRCTTCHGGKGPSDTELSVAGTVFTVRGTSDPLVDAEIVVTDATGATRTARSNEAGNFFITRDAWSPTFPLRAAIAKDGARREMITTIGRDGGCAACHRGAGDAELMPGVFLRDR